MTTRRTPRAKTPTAHGESQDVRMKKARRLPMFGPGLVITVPMSLLPEYLELYQLTPMTRGEVIDHETASKHRKPAGMLYVKRAEKPE
jgi:hypothetical protein